MTSINSIPLKIGLFKKTADGKAECIECKSKGRENAHLKLQKVVQKYSRDIFLPSTKTQIISKDT